jgi:hypothetical protein
MTASLMLCRNGTVSPPTSDSAQLLPGPTISVGPFVRMSVAPYG